MFYSIRDYNTTAGVVRRLYKYMHVHIEKRKGIEGPWDVPSTFPNLYRHTFGQGCKGRCIGDPWDVRERC